MLRHGRGTLLSLGLALAATLVAPSVAPAQTCTLDYQRADNMWAAVGRPDGNLGVESLALPAGQKKVFVTDWRYEKQRNDGTNYYGSHLRIATNRGQAPVRMTVKLNTLLPLKDWVQIAIGTYLVTLSPGQSLPVSVDLMEVYCPVLKR